MKCSHSYMHIRQVTRVDRKKADANDVRYSHTGIRFSSIDEYGAVAGCVKCGHVVTVWENGDVEGNQE